MNNEKKLYLYQCKNPFEIILFQKIVISSMLLNKGVLKNDSLKKPFSHRT